LLLLVVVLLAVVVIIVGGWWLLLVVVLLAVLVVGGVVGGCCIVDNFGMTDDFGKQISVARATVHLECIRGCHPRTQEFPQHVIYRWTRRLASAIIISSNSGKRMFENQKCVNAMLKFIYM
jgi:hypothetical protein